MKKYKIGFTGEEYEESSLEDYLNSWIVFSLRGNGSYAGKLISLSEKEASFLPYQKVTHNDKGMPRYIIKYDGKPSSYPINDIVGKRETSEKEIKNFCKNMNQVEKINWLKQRLELNALEKQFSDKTN